MKVNFISLLNTPFVQINSIGEKKNTLSGNDSDASVFRLLLHKKSNAQYYKNISQETEGYKTTTQNTTTSIYTQINPTYTRFQLPYVIGSSINKMEIGGTTTFTLQLPDENGEQFIKAEGEDFTKNAYTYNYVTTSVFPVSFFI